MTRGFDDRKDFAAKMHRRWFAPAMTAYWDVDDGDVQLMTGDSDGAITADRAGGIDAIVQTAGAAPVFVAERVRTLRQHRSSTFRPDFSLRERTATGDDSEFVRLMDAHRTGRDLPSVYLFGIGAGTSRQDCLNDGLSALFWIDTRELLASIDAGELEADRHRSETGELTRYYSIDDLRRCDCLRADVAGQALRTVFDDYRPVDAGFPSAEAGVHASRTCLQDFSTST